MTLLYPSFLFALAAVAIPVAVHLFRFRRYRNVYFSNVRHLEELRQESRRLRRLRRWLVLAARVAAVTMLVLACCQPVVMRKGQGARRGTAAVSIYIDNSFSMAGTGSEGPLLELAVRKAREIAAAYGNGDRYQLLTSDLQGSQFRWLSRDELLAQLDALQPSPASPMLSTVTRRQADFLRRSGARETAAYVISDFQRSTADFAALEQDSLVQVTLVPLEAGDAGNIYIDSLSLGAPVLLSGAAVTVQAFLRNDGDRPVANVPVRLYVDGRACALATADLPAGGSAAVPLRFTLPRAGALQGRVETTDYPVTFDDTMYFAVNVRQRLQVLTVNGGADNSSLRRLFGADSAIRYAAVDEGAVPWDALGSYALVILNALRDIPGGLAQTLHAYVQEGGSLLVVPAEGCDADSYNRMLALFSAPRLAPWREGTVRAVSINTRQRLYGNVFSPSAGDVAAQAELPTLQGACRQQGGGDVVRESIIALADGSDYLSATPCGNGSLYLLSAPLEERWTDFVMQALFVPTLYNMALYGGSVGVPYFTPSAAAVPLWRRYHAEALPHLVSADGSVDLIPFIRSQGGRSCLVPQAALATAGGYELRLRGDSVAEALAFNYSRRESAMQFHSPGEVARALRDRHLAGYGILRGTSRPLDAEIRAARDGKPLWRWCIAAALALLLAEELIIRVKKPLRGAVQPPRGSAAIPRGSAAIPRGSAAAVTHAKIQPRARRSIYMC